MIIRCIKCKKEFEQQYSERHCGCLKFKQHKEYYRLYQKNNYIHTVLYTLRLNFQNPIYQYKKNTT